MNNTLKNRKKCSARRWAILLGLTCVIAYVFHEYRVYSSKRGTQMGLYLAGKDISALLLAKEVWKTYDGSMSFHEEWEAMRNQAPDHLKRFFDPCVWTVVMNIPESPPSNLIVLATSNVDPSSLRTRLTSEDMQKQIQFVPANHLPISLGKRALLVRADCMVRVPKSGQPHFNKYDFIYGGKPFDATTNSSGLRVKYVLSDGTEFVPDND